MYPHPQSGGVNSTVPAGHQATDQAGQDVAASAFRQPRVAGGGAAWLAYCQFGAIMGQGVGLQGQSYAIPTMQGWVETIKPYVDEFIKFAKQHPELFFFVTRIGCGIAGFRDDEIATLFVGARWGKVICLPVSFVVAV